MDLPAQVGSLHRSFRVSFSSSLRCAALLAPCEGCPCPISSPLIPAKLHSQQSLSPRPPRRRPRRNGVQHERHPTESSSSSLPRRSLLHRQSPRIRLSRRRPRHHSHRRIHSPTSLYRHLLHVFHPTSSSRIHQCRRRRRTDAPMQSSRNSRTLPSSAAAAAPSPPAHSRRRSRRQHRHPARSALLSSSTTPMSRGGYRGGPGPLRRGFWGRAENRKGGPLRSGRSEGIGAKGGEYVPEGPKLQIFFAHRAIKTSEIAPNLTEGGANVPKICKFSQASRDTIPNTTKKSCI